MLKRLFAWLRGPRQRLESRVEPTLDAQGVMIVGGRRPGTTTALERRRRALAASGGESRVIPRGGLDMPLQRSQEARARDSDDGLAYLAAQYHPSTSPGLRHPSVLATPVNTVDHDPDTRRQPAAAECRVRSFDFGAGDSWTPRSSDGPCDSPSSSSDTSSPTSSD